MKALDEKGAMAHALKLLSVRGRSRQELELALTRREVPPEVRERVLLRLSELGYVNDAQYALERARTLLLRGRLGSRGVIERLSAQGIPEATAQAATHRMAEELGLDPLTQARGLLEKRGLLGRPLSLKESARAARLLEARGFEPEVIRRLIPSVALESGDLDG